METRLKKLAALLKEVGLKNPKIEKFEDRLRIQKLTYIFKYMNIDLGYTFSRHIRGPYCKHLADDYFQGARDLIEKQEVKFDFSEDEIDAINKIKQSLGIKPSVLEIASTYMYLTKEENYTPDQAFLKIKEIKKYYSDSEISYAITKAKELYQPSKKELEEIEKDNKIWENADDDF